MMMNLFSVFDPTSSMNYSMNWISMMFIMLYIPSLYWFIPSRYNMMFMMMLFTLMNEFKILLMKKINIMNILLFLSMFIMIMMNNFMGMFPYIFTASSHLSFSLSLSLIFWLSFMIYGWLMNTNHMFSHLVPQGTPTILMPFMVIIETISNIIRSGTLAVRLSANMIAGHLLMTLISSNGPSMSMIMIMILVILQSLLIILELSVSIIQAYVFSVLSTLYSSESN